MAPKIASSTRSRQDQLRHLAIVFKVEIRLKIVAELYIREMSPKEFHDEFGGGSVSRVAQHFEVLAEHGWLRRVGYKGRETKRRGPSETLYRATELAFFDAEMWASLPYSLRLAWSWSTFKATANELRMGIESAAFEGCLSRGLTCTPLELDQLGWTRVIAKLGAHFESIFEEQDDSKIRVARSGEELFRAGIFQVGFESPRSSDRLALGLADGTGEPLVPFPERLAPIFADDLCMQIIAELNTSGMSVKQFHREFANNSSECVVRHRFGRLKDLAWLVIVDKVKRRGAQEYIYRATKPTIANNGPWADVPDALRATDTWATFECLSNLVKEAIVSGTFDIRDNRHLSWSIVNLDLEGWENVTADMDALSAFVCKEERRARHRIKAGAKPLTMIVALYAAESPVGPVKAP